MGFNICVLLKEAWARLKWPGGCCLHQACFMWMLLAWPQALSSEFFWPVKETSLNMIKLEELPIASFQQCTSSPVLESGPDVVCHLPSSVQSPTWDTFSFFLPLPTSLLSLLSLFSLSFPQLLLILMTLWSVRLCIRAKLPDCLSSPLHVSDFTEHPTAGEGHRNPVLPRVSFGLHSSPQREGESAVPAIYMWVILREAQRDATQVFNQALPQHLVGSSLKLGGRSEFLRQ